MVAEHASRFVWLFEESALSETPPPTRGEFVAACEFALSNWQVLPAVGPRLLHWGRDVSQDIPYVRQIDDQVTAIKTLAQVQLLLCKRLVDRLERRRIPYTLLKGIAARLCAYPMPDLRCGLDVDIGVTRKYLQVAEDVATELGFLPASLVGSGRHFAPVTAAERA